MTDLRSITRGVRNDGGFSILELTIAMGLMLVIVVGTSSALLKMSSNSRTIWNRTEMHAGVRGATELLQQEVGQAGLVSLPGVVTLSAPVVAGAGVNATLSSSAGFFVGEKVIADTGPNAETVTVTAVAAGQITANFVFPHPAGVPFSVAGGFWGGIVP